MLLKFTKLEQGAKMHLKHDEKKALNAIIDIPTYRYYVLCWKRDQCTSIPLTSWHITERSNFFHILLGEGPRNHLRRFVYPLCQHPTPSTLRNFILKRYYYQVVFRRDLIRKLKVMSKIPRKSCRPQGLPENLTKTKGNN